MTGLTIRGLRKSFGAVTALAGVDLDVPARSLTAVLGPSGCGKTTLLRLVAGFTVPDAGTIAFDDAVVSDQRGVVPPQRRHIGYVPQEGALFPHLRVADNITFGLPRAQRRRASRRLAELLDLVELDEASARRYPHELSGGQQQRVALARALAREPAVVLLDEPFSSLDAGLRLATGRAVSRALRAAGATALLVTHDQGEALALADQVAVMLSGQVVQVGPPRRIYATPVDAEVARFVGDAVLLPATVTAATARTALGELPVRSGAIDGDADVLIRPEQITLHDQETGLAATVVGVTYHGHDAVLTLSVEPDGPTVTARVTGSHNPGVGSRVHLRVDSPVVAFPVDRS